MKTIKLICKWTTVLAAFLAVLLAAALVGAQMFGLQAFTVLSGSMSPAYNRGSLIYVEKVDFRDLKVGDVITYSLADDTVATHRIIDVIADEGYPDAAYFRTRGDAEAAENGSVVHSQDIVGKPVFSVPHLGYVASFIQTPAGAYILIALGLLLGLLMLLPDLLLREEPEQKRWNTGKGGRFAKDSNMDCDMPQLTEEDIDALEDNLNIFFSEDPVLTLGETLSDSSAVSPEINSARELSKPERDLRSDFFSDLLEPPLEDTPADPHEASLETLSAVLREDAFGTGSGNAEEIGNDGDVDPMDAAFDALAGRNEENTGDRKNEGLRS